MLRFLAGTRYLVALPVLGLGIAASFFFIFGGIGLIKFLEEGWNEAGEERAGQ